MKEVLRRLLQREWPSISGGRPRATIIWCEVDRRDIQTTYERVIRVVTALSDVGGRGKEVWMNLTGGTNVLNFALKLAATLSGDVARLYYVQAENPVSEKCVRFTADTGYWVELPVMPLALSRLSLAVIGLLQDRGPMEEEDLFSTLLSHPVHWNLGQGMPVEAFKDLYLMPMWKQGLIAAGESGYVIGEQWALIQPYQKTLQLSRQAKLTVEQLTKQETWIEQEEITLS